MEKRIAKEIYNITEQEKTDDFLKLKQDTEMKLLGLKGSKFVNFYTSYARLYTKGNKGLSFFEFLEKIDEVKNRPSFKRFMDYETKKNPKKTEIRKLWRFFNFYFDSINIFKPIIAKSIFFKYKPHSILDFTMGWGGRLVGACSLDVPKYTGIEINMRLKQPYQAMTKELKKHSSTQIKLYFKNALEIDYRTIKYDMVLTSPPYYNTEIYEGTTRKKKEEWEAEFYIPLITTTFENMDEGGVYCLNVPWEIYNRVCVKILGEADEMIDMSKVKRTQNEKYGEKIYIWKKPAPASLKTSPKK